MIGGTNSQSGALNINFNFVLPALKEANQSFQNSLKKATTSLDSLLNNAESLNISMSLSNSTGIFKKSKIRNNTWPYIFLFWTKKVVAVRGAFVDLTSANTTFGSTIPVLLQNSTSFMSKANLQSVILFPFFSPSPLPSPLNYFRFQQMLMMNQRLQLFPINLFLWKRKIRHFGLPFQLRKKKQRNWKRDYKKLQLNFQT